MSSQSDKMTARIAVSINRAARAFAALLKKHHLSTQTPARQFGGRFGRLFAACRRAYADMCEHAAGARPELFSALEESLREARDIARNVTPERLKHAALAADLLDWVRACYVSYGL